MGQEEARQDGASRMRQEGVWKRQFAVGEEQVVKVAVMSAQLQGCDSVVNWLSWCCQNPGRKGDNKLIEHYVHTMILLMVHIDIQNTPQIIHVGWTYI